MRAAAILLVMASHVPFVQFIPGGFGITLFFFLSGYLITTLLRLEASSTGRINLPGFYFRRTVRIIPPMLLVIGFVVLLQLAGALPNRLTPAGLATDLAFLTNYAPQLGTSTAVQIPLWSLDVEEHFYIGFSLLFTLYLAKRSPSAAAAVCAALCALVLGVRYLHVLAGSDLELIYYWSHTRMDSILFGCILALWNNPLVDERPYKPSNLAVLLAGGLLIAALIIRDDLFRQTLRYSAQGIGLMVVFSWLLQLEPRHARIFAIWPIRWIAALSYTLYLVHMPLLYAAEHLGLTPAWLWGYGATLVFAVASYLLIEQPLGRWRRNVEKRSAIARREPIPAP